MKLKSIITLLLIFFGCSNILSAQKKIKANKIFQFEKKPSWSDEFSNDNLPDNTKWKFETGGDGFGNHELEFYTNGKNVLQKNGVLILTSILPIKKITFPFFREIFKKI